MNIKDITALAAAVGPMVLAVVALVGLVVNFLISKANNVKLIKLSAETKSIGENLTLTKDHINSRMSELLAVVSNEKLLVGEKIGIAKGMLQAIERQEAEAAAREAGRLSGGAAPGAPLSTTALKASLKNIISQANTEDAVRKAVEAANANNQATADNTKATAENTKAIDKAKEGNE